MSEAAICCGTYAEWAGQGGEAGGPTLDQWACRGECGQTFTTPRTD